MQRNYLPRITMTDIWDLLRRLPQQRLLKDKITNQPPLKCIGTIHKETLRQDSLSTTVKVSAPFKKRHVLGYSANIFYYKYPFYQRREIRAISPSHILSKTLKAFRFQVLIFLKKSTFVIFYHPLNFNPKSIK